MGGAKAGGGVEVALGVAATIVGVTLDGWVGAVEGLGVAVESTELFNPARIATDVRVETGLSTRTRNGLPAVRTMTPVNRSYHPRATV